MKHIHKKPDDDRTGIIWRKPEAQHILTMAAFWDFVPKVFETNLSFRYKWVRNEKKDNFFNTNF